VIAERAWRDALVVLAFGVTLGVMNFSIYQAFDRIPLGIAVTIEFLGPLGVAIASSRKLIDVLWVLLAGTGVRIHVRNRMGKVVVPSGVTKGDMVEPGIRDSVVGDGSGELTIEAVMSSVSIGTDGIGGAQWGWASAGGAA